MTKETLRAVIFLHRKADDQDFNEVINCVPDSRMNYLERALIERQNAGEIDTVQIGRHRNQAHPLSQDFDQVDIFLARLDSVRLHSSTDRATPSEGEDDGSIPSEASSFTGFDNVEATNKDL